MINLTSNSIILWKKTINWIKYNRIKQNLNVNLKIILKFMKEVINFDLKSNQTEINFVKK